MKINIKFLVYLPVTVLVLTVIGFIASPTMSNKQHMFDAVLGIYYPILTLLGGIVAFAAIIWVIKQGSKIHIENGASSAVGLMGKFFSRTSSVVPITLGWLVFIATIMYLHPDIWNAWYGNQHLFWLSQAVFVLVLIVFHSHKEAFYLLITSAVLVSFWYGFFDELKENGLFVETPKSVSAKVVQGKWHMCWEETAIASKDTSLKEVPCSKKSTVLYVDFEEYNSQYIIFSVSWKEKGVFGRWIDFYWNRKDKYGVWTQSSPYRKDKGNWKIEMVNDSLFIGMVTSSNTGKTYPMTIRLID